MAAESSKVADGDYFDALQRGVFCELGKGSVDFKKIIDALNDNAYQDWVVVEQDILPGMGEPKKCALANREYLRTFGL